MKVGAVFWFRLLAALCAFIAAVFWFLSAWGKLPPIIPYLGYTPPDDPFTLALAHSAAMNQFAAVAAGFSAGFAAIAELLASWRSGKSR